MVVDLFEQKHPLDYDSSVVNLAVLVALNGKKNKDELIEIFKKTNIKLLFDNNYLRIENKYYIYK